MIAAAPILWDDCKLKKEKKKRVNACTAKQILWECKWMSMDAPKDLLLPVEDKKQDKIDEQSFIDLQVGAI